MAVVCAVGINHRAPLALRELMAMSKARVAESLRLLKRDYCVDETAILSTCNRTEVYCVAGAADGVLRWFNQSAADSRVGDYVYQLQSEAAVNHLFRVASGLDSQLLGEPEITGQVKAFAALAREVSTAGPVINRLMESALHTAKAVRAQTDIGRRSLSYAGLAAQAAASIFPDLRGVSVLLVGTGDMSLSGGTVFGGRGVRRLAVAGRRLEKTEKIAAQINAEPMLIANVPSVLAEFDVVISASASQVPIIGKGAVESALRLRRHKPMMFADLALPRDLEDEIRQLPDVFVYHLDQFARMAQLSLAEREAASVQAQRIIDRQVAAFCRWWRQRRHIGSVRQWRATAQGICDRELQSALAQAQSGKDTETVLRGLAHRLTAQLTHAPTQWLLEAKADEPDLAEKNQ